MIMNFKLEEVDYRNAYVIKTAYMFGDGNYYTSNEFLTYDVDMVLFYYNLWLMFSERCTYDNLFMDGDLNKEIQKEEYSELCELFYKVFDKSLYWLLNDVTELMLDVMIDNDENHIFLAEKFEVFSYDNNNRPYKLNFK